MVDQQRESILSRYIFFSKLYSDRRCNSFGDQQMIAQIRTGDSSKTVAAPMLSYQSSFVLHGIAASMLLSLTYFLIASIAESFDHATTQFLSLSYLFIPLIASFGIQIGLFS